MPINLEFAYFGSEPYVSVWKPSYLESDGPVTKPDSDWEHQNSSILSRSFVVEAVRGLRMKRKASELDGPKNRFQRTCFANLIAGGGLPPCLDKPISPFFLWFTFPYECLHIHECMYMYAYIYIYICMYLSIYLSMYIYIYMYLYINLCICMYVFLPVNMACWTISSICRLPSQLTKPLFGGFSCHVWCWAPQAGVAAGPTLHLLTQLQASDTSAGASWDLAPG